MLLKGKVEERVIQRNESLQGTCRLVSQGGDRFSWARGRILDSASIFPELSCLVSLFPLILTFFTVLSGSTFQPLLDIFNQGLANYSPWAKSIPPPVFVNIVLLAHRYTYLFTCCLWLFCAIMAEL